MRSFLLLKIATGFALLLSFAVPATVQAQYPGYLPQRYPRYHPPAEMYPPPGINIQELEGTWYGFGNEEIPCQIIPSQRGDSATFVNEKGDRVTGYFRGNRILVPKWRIQGVFDGNAIQWSNNTVWTR